MGLPFATLLDALFINTLFENPVAYFTLVVGVIMSIVLHELGHGFAAIRQGDDTPIITGHMTLNPYVHMGPIGLGLLFVVGIAFGAMPVNPSRFRSKYGDAIVAAAGPAVNLVLALIALTAYSLLARQGIRLSIQEIEPLFVLGWLNVVLFLLNLIPVPPLDGSRVLGNFVPAFRDFTNNPDNAGFVSAAFILVFFMAGRLLELGARVANEYVGWLVAL